MNDILAIVVYLYMIITVIASFWVLHVMEIMRDADLKLSQGMEKWLRDFKWYHAPLYALGWPFIILHMLRQR